MKLLFSRDNLFNAVQDTIKFISSNKKNLVYQNFYFETIRTGSFDSERKGMMKIAGTDGALYFEKMFVCEVSEETSFLLPAKILHDFLKQTPLGSLIEVEKFSNHIEMTVNTTKISINMISSDLFPVKTEKDAVRTLIFNGEELSTALNTCLPFVAKKATKIEYGAIQFILNKCSVDLYASNYQLIAKAHYNEYEDIFQNEDENVIFSVSADTMKKVIKVFKNSTSIEMIFCNGEIIFNDKLKRLYAPLVEKHIHSITSLFEKEYNYSAIFDKSQVLDAVKRVENITSEITNGIEFEFIDDYCNIKSLNTSYGYAIEEVNPIETNIDQNENTFILNSKHLIEMLEKIDEEVVYFAFNGRRLPVKIFSLHDNAEFVVMPIALDRN